MNAFTRGLFQLLIGWVRSLTALWDGDWTRADSLFDWLVRHWLGVTLLLMLIGTAADLVIWLFRWRPDLTWKSRWKKLQNFSLSGYLHELRFHRGYNQDNTQIMEAARPLPDQPLTARALSAPEQQASFRPLDALEEREQLEEQLGVSRRSGPLPDQPLSLDGEPRERRRRSDRYRSGLRGAVRQVRERFHEDEEDGFEPDILPPIMSKEEAFRAPVYPNGRRGGSAGKQEGEEG